MRLDCPCIGQGVPILWCWQGWEVASCCSFLKLPGKLWKFLAEDCWNTCWNLCGNILCQVWKTELAFGHQHHCFGAGFSSTSPWAGSTGLPGMDARGLRFLWRIFMPATTEYLRSPLFVEWGSRAVLDLWPSPIVKVLFRSVSCGMSLCAKSNIHGRSGNLFLKHQMSWTESFLCGKYDCYISLGGSSWELGMQLRHLLGTRIWICFAVIFCMVLLDLKIQRLVRRSGRWFLPVYSCIYRSICLFTYLLNCLSFCLSSHSSIHLLLSVSFFFPSISSSIHVHSYRSPCSSFCFSIDSSMHLSVYLFFQLSIYLATHAFIWSSTLLAIFRCSDLCVHLSIHLPVYWSICLSI